MTHSYTVCERSFDQRGSNGQYMPIDHSGLKFGGGAGNSRVAHISRHDQLEEELDPCLSAALRYRKEPSGGLARLKCLLCCVVGLLALALLAVALLMFFGSDNFSESPQRMTQFGRSVDDTLINKDNQTKESGDSYHGQPFTKGPFWGRAVHPQFVKTATTKGLALISSKSTSKRPTVVVTHQTTLLPTTPKKNVSEDVRDCDFLRKYEKETGVSHPILLEFGDFRVKSDNGWIVLQRRTSDRFPFWNNTFDDYAVGFGELDVGGDGWLGLNWIHALSEHCGKLQMRIRLEGDLCEMKSKRSCSGFGDNGSWWGDWEFSLGNRSEGFRIDGLQFLRGNLSFKESDLDLFRNLCDGSKFTTVDVDNDMNKMGNCAEFRERGAWWHSDCAHTVLNGRYGMTSPTTHGMFWNRPSPHQKTGGLLAHDAYIIKPKKSLILVRIPDR